MSDLILLFVLFVSAFVAGAMLQPIPAAAGDVPVPHARRERFN
jgi:hypothetical protein